jgi:hypothetical protein
LKLLAAPTPENVSFLSILNIRFITRAFGALAIAAGTTGAEVVGARVIGAYIIGAKVIGAESDSAPAWLRPFLYDPNHTKTNEN